MIVYATDEDIALRASADFAGLCPRDQLLASGTDGTFAVNNLWTLTSPSVDFVANGLMPGQVIRLTRPSTTFGPNGEMFAIGSVQSGGIKLRRKGQADGVGQSPSTTSGLSLVEFAVRTLGPQIRRASDDLNRRYGIDDATPGRRASDLYDPHQLREAVVLIVLTQQYFDQSRQFSGASSAPDDWFASKARLAKAELDEVLDRLTLRWNQANVGSRAASTTRFSTRISR